MVTISPTSSSRARSRTVRQYVFQRRCGSLPIPISTSRLSAGGVQTENSVSGQMISRSVVPVLKRTWGRWRP
jgi:hypothetical protein